MPLLVVGVVLALGYIGMGRKNREKFWAEGLSGLWTPEISKAATEREDAEEGVNPFKVPPTGH